MADIDKAVENNAAAEQPQTEPRMERRIFAYSVGSMLAQTAS